MLVLTLGPKHPEKIMFFAVWCREEYGAGGHLSTETLWELIWNALKSLVDQVRNRKEAHLADVGDRVRRRGEMKG